MNDIVYLSSDEEDDKRDGFLETSDEKPKNIGHHHPKSDPTVEDDDCVVLDCDPYKMTAKENAIDTCETDDVLVVGQKGEIACRDYPHSRHACAKYPFNSTSHESYCEMCHCYVCDTRAPCAYWFMGYSYIDHCHANDKEELWKNQRACIRTGKILPGPASTIVQSQRVSLPQSIPLPHGKILPGPVSKPASTIVQSQRVPRPQSIPLPQYSSSPVTQFGSIQLPHNSSLPATQLGIRACSASISVATHPNTYISPGYRAELPRTFPQNPGLQPRGGQSYQNHRGGSYNGNHSPQVVSSNPFTWTQTPSGGVIRPGNNIHSIAQGSQYTGYAPCAAVVPSYIPTVPESHNIVYARHYGQNMYSGNVQTNATVPSQMPNRPVNLQLQQQHSGKSLSEIEAWLMKP
ncbi:unnamed protein product [Arabis nemorensis]|uniref:RPM1 interacting protein 13 n=1 Tax=Arabis nemorensis TaxID=586526 RepID=A0A565CCC6_9BRAS|nr:unnamed protein product [Arabis nemorensis]